MPQMNIPKLGILLPILGMLCSCTAVNMYVGVGYDTHLNEGTNPRSDITIEGIAKCGPADCYARFQHNSSIFDGWPFNNNLEDLTNQWSTGVKIPLWRKK